METIVTAALSTLLSAEVVLDVNEPLVDLSDYNELSLDSAHLFTCIWQQQQHPATEKENTHSTFLGKKRSADDYQIFIQTLTQKTIKLKVNPSDTTDDVMRMLQMQEKVPPEQQRLMFAGEQLMSQCTLYDSKVQTESTIHMVLRMRGGGLMGMKINDEEFDPQYDYTYPPRGTEGEDYRRGSKVFKRAYGWTKYAIHVLGKYGEDDWLGVSACPNREYDVYGEWPVSYHGTQCMSVNQIVMRGYEIHRGQRFKYGRGIYSTPCPAVAEKYATTFEYCGKMYKSIIMNRVNPAYSREVDDPQFGKYYITSDQTQIRAYAILIKRMS